jgi:hypothetical protein
MLREYVIFISGVEHYWSQGQDKTWLLTAVIYVVIVKQKLFHFAGPENVYLGEAIPEKSFSVTE